MKTKKKTYQFSIQLLKNFERLKQQFPDNQSKAILLPMLHLVQANDEQGYLSVVAMDAIAEYLDIHPVEVYEVASFYSMFHLKPVGKCVIEVCQTSSCWLCGANQILDTIKEVLKINVGETTDDGMFTLKAVECLGACDGAPMCQIGQKYYENLNRQKIIQIIEQEKKAKQEIHSRYCDPKVYPFHQK